MNKKSMKISASIIGGVGDIIFGLDGFKEMKFLLKDDASGISHIETLCYLSSHCQEAKQLVEANPFVDKVQEIIFNNDLSHLSEIRKLCEIDKTYIGEAKQYNDTIYPEIFLPQKINTWVSTFIEANFPKAELIIIHPCGSEFSRYFLTEKQHVHSKELVNNIWNDIINLIHIFYLLKNKKPSIIVIGSKDNKDYINSILDDKYKHCNFAGKFSLLETISIIKRASLVIGVDSLAKSISLASKINTIVFVNDNKDQIRDSVFLNPYENDNNALIIKDTNKLHNVKILSIIENYLHAREQNAKY